MSTCHVFSAVLFFSEDRNCSRCIINTFLNTLAHIGILYRYLNLIYDVFYLINIVRTIYTYYRLLEYWATLGNNTYLNMRIVRRRWEVDFFDKRDFKCNTSSICHTPGVPFVYIHYSLHVNLYDLCNIMHLSDTTKKLWSEINFI